MDRAAQELKPHRKIAFLIPAGEIVNHDRVLSYGSRDRDQALKANLNLGDTFVFEASLRLIGFEQIVCLGTHSNDPDRALAELNDCDLAIVRGSNYLHPHMDWGNLPAIVERSRVPVVAFGIGAQASRYEPVKLSEKTIRFLKVIGERSHRVGCRGSFSASVLEGIGVKNVAPIGCPSLFRQNNPAIRIGWPPERLRTVGFTLTRGFSPGYCDDPKRATQRQLALLKKLNEEYDLFVLSQGERAEKIFHYRAYERLEEARASMRATGWNIDRLPWLEDLYWKRIFYGLSPADYEAMVKRCDLVVGLRLHGNIMALAEGIPSIYVTYDSRTREIVEQFSIPHWDIMERRNFSLKRFLDQGAFDRFNARFRANYDTMRDFLAANGIRHRMSQD